MPSVADEFKMTCNEPRPDDNVTSNEPRPVDSGLAKPKLVRKAAR